VIHANGPKNKAQLLLLLKNRNKKCSCLCSFGGLLKYDEYNIYAEMLLKKRHLNRICNIYILDHNYNPNLSEALNMVMYYLHEECDDLEKCQKIVYWILILQCICSFQRLDLLACIHP